MSRFKKLLSLFSLTVIISISMVILSHAAAGRLSGAVWDEQTGIVYWEDAVDDPQHTTYEITLYRGNAKRMSSRIRTKNCCYDFASIISTKGTGVYYAIVSVSGSENTAVTSEQFPVDSTVLKLLKEKTVSGAEEKWMENEEGRYGWLRYPEGVWRYRKNDGSYAIGWLLDNGKWYYLADNGNMLTGWQIINNRWYYLDEVNGDLYVSRSTPDGMFVNGNGECEVNGVPVDASWQPKNTIKNAAKNLTELDTIKINSLETKVDSYVVRPMRVTNSGKFTVEKYSFSKPYEQWVAGERIRVTCEIYAYTGYVFTDRTKITFNRGTLVSNTGDATSRVIVYDYYPRYVLGTPENLYLDDAGELHWGPVDKASKYVVSVFINGVKEDDKTVRKTSIDLSEYMSSGNVGVKVSAIANESMRNYWYDSFPAELEDVTEAKPGDRVTYDGNRIRYVDETGRPAVGWAMINGNWYHFTRGLSEAPGWFCDDDNFWYYFDYASRMKTGYITDKGVTYFLNDGSIKDIPLGAWVK